MKKKLLLILVFILIFGGGIGLGWYIRTPISTSNTSPTSATSIIGNNPYNWPVQDICIPLYRPEDPVVIKDLHDGTYIYQRSDGTLFRGNQNRCKCLSARTLISTPDGSKMVKDLKIGMYVYTLDRKDNKSIVRIIKVARISVPNNYLISHVILSDNRELFASNAHPTSNGRTIGELLLNDILDGARVMKKSLIPYGDPFTYDILPDGDTGLYWANGILLKSTISK